MQKDGGQMKQLRGIFMKGDKIQLTRVTPIEVGQMTAEIYRLLGKPFKIFDFKYAIKLCRRHNIQNAYIGLAEDWFYTKAIMLDDGMPCSIEDNIPYDFCIASSWATPCLYDVDTDVAYACYYEDKEPVDSYDIWWSEEMQQKYLNGEIIL